MATTQSSSPTLKLRFKSPQKSGFISVSSTCSTNQLYEVIAYELNLPLGHFNCNYYVIYQTSLYVPSVSFGYPPKIILSEDGMADLSTVGIHNNETILVSFQSTKTWTPPPTTGQMVIREMPDDNSCLFSSIAHVFRTILGSGGAETSRYEQAQMLRQVAAVYILEHPERFTDTVLERPRAAYIQWIQEPNSWGGAIELAIFADLYGCEIGSIDVQSGRIDIFGNY